MRRALARWIGVAALVFGSLGGVAQAAWPAGAAPIFGLRIGDHLIPRDTASVYAAPGSVLRIAARALPRYADLEMNSAPPLTETTADPGHWRVTVPKRPGAYSLTVRNRATGAALPVNVFVKAPFDIADETINGYDIGHYQPTPRHDNPIYDPPRSLLEISASDVDRHLSPHFVIGQFLCHQQPDRWPKYALVRPLLVDKLEAILAALGDRGIEADTLTVMSGYRTPDYNASIGNTTIYSRHLYGGAADIFVDTNGDGDMDDLDGNGRVDVGDARWLAHLVEALDTQHPRLVGGLSAYPATSHHGPFVHIDVRGQAVRW